MRALVAVLLFLAGCLGPSTTSIEVLNETEDRLSVELWIHHGDAEVFHERLNLSGHAAAHLTAAARLGAGSYEFRATAGNRTETRDAPRPSTWIIMDNATGLSFEFFGPARPIH